ncbi:FAD binding domain-containing protein [Boeremia exigua]|uniref:FAD binding domain-containing protein n=1 Tax=Boeremia exigua TaxID=749465 RepID=UPI001E8E8765|nr:FAD binding domain-containing protein [Boeremia exigua]KAH6642818.1 FAD binding domain-containing protein [Boeremia exigua]
MTPQIQEDILIIGAGPAGGALAAFLGQNGLSGLVISKDSSTAFTPRAHGFNPFAFECLRDIDLEEEGLRLAIRGSTALSMRFSGNLIGEREYGRVSAWSEHPASAARVKETTPCEYVDLTQRHVEPLLLRYASHHGFRHRFSTELIGIEPISDDLGTGYLCTIQDHITNYHFKIRAKYLFAADGGRSHVARSLNFNFSITPGGPKACNVLIKADLGHLLVEKKYAALNWVIQPDRKIFPGVVAHLRVVRPWNEWVLAGFGPGGTNPFEGFTTESPEIVDLVRELVGDRTIDVKVLKIDPWTVREAVADHYSKGDNKVFLLGDAAHRHPPTFGLGSNTCIQDAYNLAWKVAYVTKGWAGPGLLDTYSQERQPIGADLVRESNNQLRHNSNIWDVLGMVGSREDGVKKLEELTQPTSAGSDRRERLHEVLEHKRQELESVGLAYNHWYTSSAVYLDDEESPRPTLEGDQIVEVQISTYPGSRLPHVWLDMSSRSNLISTLDLAGKGSFCLLFGVGGEAWRAAAQRISSATNIPIVSYGIGHGLDYMDIRRDWRSKRGVAETGCVLVRPDRFVAWRSTGQPGNCEEKLMHVLDKVLFREASHK